MLLKLFFGKFDLLYYKLKCNDKRFKCNDINLKCNVIRLEFNLLVIFG